MGMYILYDERGVFVPEIATIFEAFDAVDDVAAFTQAVLTWPKHGWALHDSEKDGDSLIAWSSPKKKSISRWFYEWDEVRQFGYNGKRQQPGKAKS
jgi:hypothetical protein